MHGRPVLSGKTTTIGISGRLGTLGAFLLALVIGGCTSMPARLPPSPGPSPSADVPAPTSPDAAEIDAFLELLAGSGVAVHANEEAERPLREVEGQTVFAVTRWQLENMVFEALTGGGTPGEELDAAVVTPEGAPPFSYLLAAWIAVGGTPGSTRIAEIMGERDWTLAPAHGYPALAVVLFVADAARAAAGEEGAQDDVEVGTGLTFVAERDAAAVDAPIVLAVSRVEALAPGWPALFRGDRLRRQGARSRLPGAPGGPVPVRRGHPRAHPGLPDIDLERGARLREGRNQGRDP